MESMFSAVLRIGLIITMWSSVHLLSIALKKDERLAVKILAILSIILILLTGFIFFVVLAPR